MATQAQVIQSGAEDVYLHAKLAGQRAAVPKGTEASMVLEQAMAMAIADMVGPGYDTARANQALEFFYNNMRQSLAAQLLNRHGYPVDRKRT